MTNDRRNRPTKSRKHLKIRRNENLQILGNIGIGNHQICGGERKNEKKNTSAERENYSKPNDIAEISSKGKNTRAVPIVRYSGPFLKCTREELQQMNQRTRKLMVMYKALHSRDNIDRL